MRTIGRCDVVSVIPDHNYMTLPSTCREVVATVLISSSRKAEKCLGWRINLQYKGFNSLMTSIKWLVTRRSKEWSEYFSDRNLMSCKMSNYIRWQHWTLTSRLISGVIVQVFSFMGTFHVVLSLLTDLTDKGRWTGNYCSV